MAGAKDLLKNQTLYFWRIALIVSVSYWATDSAFGRETKNNQRAPSQVDEFKEFEEETPAPKPKAKDPKSPPTPIEQAHEHFAKKEYAKVTPLLWKHVDQLERRDFHILLKSHSELNQADDLLRASSLLVSKNERDFEAHHYQGKAYILKKKEKEALSSLKKSIENNSKYLPSYVLISEIYEKKKNLYELRALYQDMMKVFGPRPEILGKLCDFNTQDGLNEVAEKYCKAGIQKDPENPDNHVNLGIVILQIGDRTKGREQLKKASEKFPKSEYAQFKYGSILEEDKNYLDAYKAFKTCVEHNVNSDKCLVGHGQSAFQIQKFDEAHTSFKKLCKINRNFAVHVRKAVSSLRATNNQTWLPKFEELSEYCSLF